MKLRVTATVTRVTLVILLIVLCAVRVEPVAADLDHHVYLPRVARNGCYKEPGMSDWKLIVPEATINSVSNPSVETNLTGWASGWGDTVARSSTRAKFGLYSLQLTGAGVANCGVWYTDIAGLTVASTVTFSAWIYNLSAGGFTDLALIVWDGGGFANGVTSGVFAQNDAWTKYEVQKIVPAGGSVRVAIFGSDNAGDLWADAFMLEAQTEATTYADGDQPGCEWLGLAHASTSQRSAQSRAGGFIRDFKTDYGFGVSNFMNTGMPTQSTEIDNYALLQGGQLNDIKVEPREFTLMGILAVSKIGDCTKSLDELRAALEEELAHDRYPEGPDGWQPLLIRYTGATVEKEIAAHYSGGLEGRIALENQIQESMGLRFAAPDPNWYEIGESAQLLDTEDGPTLRYIAGRLRSTGQWDDLGLTANPTTGGEVTSIVRAPDGLVYVGGRFTGWDGNAGWDYIVAYDAVADAWARVGGASDFNAIVRGLAVAPNGDIYAVGDFTDVAAIPAADFIARWDGTNWNAVGVPVAGASAITDARALAFANSGDLYIIGDFLNWANIANADYVVLWNGAAYSAVGTPSAGAVITAMTSIAIDSTDRVYVGGNYTNFAGIAEADRIAMWDGSWNALGDGLGNTVSAIAIDSVDDVFIGGIFTNAGGVDNADRITRWNGTAFFALSTGANGGIVSIVVAPDDRVYMVGGFTIIGGLTVHKGARWNGSSFANIDMNPFGAAVFFVVGFGKDGPVVSTNYDIFAAFNATGVGAVSGSAIVANDGSAHAFPDLVVTRSGGTTAVLEQVRNETLGIELLYDYDLLDGETLTTFNHPLVQNIVSSFSKQRLDATLVGDDFGDWSLQPGDNQVTCFVDNNGATVVGYLLYRTAYKGHSD